MDGEEDGASAKARPVCGGRGADGVGRGKRKAGREVAFEDGGFPGEGE